MRALAGLLAGLVFGLGLAISGLIDPAKVLNFLDLAGRWDPSLALVMAGAAGTSLFGYRLVLARPRPVLAAGFELPATTGIDRALVLGAVLFGVGWGIGGYCPGPALTALPLLAPGTLVFVPAMLLGLWLGGQARGLAILNPQGAPS